MEAMERISHLIEYLALGIEILAVLFIVFSVVTATAIYIRPGMSGALRSQRYTAYKVRFGRGLLVGLEILVAADVVRTVALEPNLDNVAVLGLLVVIRTFLSWSLVVEMEKRWPWQPGRDDSAITDADHD